MSIKTIRSTMATMALSRSTSWLLLAAASGLLSTAGCSREAPPAATIVRPVKTYVLTAGAASRTVALPGTARAAREVELAFQVPGLLIKLPIKEGQLVAKGEVIGELRSDEARGRLASLTGQLEQAKVALRTLKAGDRPEQRLRLESGVRAAEARLASEKAQFDRYTEMRDTGAIARVDFERVEADYRVAKEELKAAQQALEIGRVGRTEDIEAREADVRGLEGRVLEATVQLNDCVLKAPFDGVIAQRLVDVNQSISVRQPIARFQSADELDVAVDVPEALMATDLRTSDLAAATAEFTAMPGRQFPVKIGEVSQLADPVTQTFRIRFSLKTPPGVNLLPGMSATVRVASKQPAGREGVLMAPIASVYTESGGSQVAWVIGKDLVATRRPVKVGAISGANIEILSGLVAGDRIASAGVSLLRDGMVVRDLGDGLGGTR